MPRRDVHRLRSSRAIARVACAIALVAAVLVATSSRAPAASSSVVVSMSVPSTTSVTNQCTQAPAWNFGAVQPGTGATTATNSNVCRIRFSSSNDTSALRMYQSDRENTAMHRADPMWDMHAGDHDGFHAVDSAPGGRVVAVGTRGNTRVSSDSGQSFPTGGVNTAGSWSTLNDVDIVSAAPDVAWVAGHSGTVLRTANAGSSWTTPTTGTSQHLWGVLAVDAATAYVGGSGGTLLRTTDSGATWAPMTSNTTNNVQDFARRDASDMWFAGSNNTLRRSTDGGNTWLAPTTAPPWGHWNAIDVLGTSTIWIAGSGSGRMVVARSTDHGATWTDGGTWDALDVEDLHAVSDLEAWVVGKDGTVARTMDGGTTWTRFAFPSTSTVFGVTQATDGRIVAVTMNEEVHRTTDGSSFSTTFDGSTAIPLTGVAVNPLDRREMVVVGDVGTVRRSTDRGVTWNTIASPTSTHLRAVSLASTGQGWAVGNGGTIIRTTDAGQSWTAQASGTSLDLLGIHAVSARVGWAVGHSGLVLRTTDAGATWTSIASGTSQHLWAVSALDDQIAWIGGAQGRIRVTTNGGSSWTSRDNPQTATVWQLHAVSATRVYAVTDWTGTLTTTDGGVTWTTGLWEGGRKAMAVIGDRFVGVTSTYGSTFLLANDGASATWHGAAGHYVHLRGMGAIDANRLVAVGENGTISVSRIRNPIADFGGAGSTWASPGSGLFGACLQDAGPGTTPVWLEDTGNTPGLCQGLSGDAWNAVPASPTTIANTTPAADAYVDIVWGLHIPPSQAPGAYLATVTFETIAPAA